MAETVSVNLSGPALAFLLYENVKSKREQEGFLLGDTNEIITKTITDTDSHNETRHTVINVNAVVTCPRSCLFYNSVGSVNQETLEDILGAKASNVVGWYLYETENNFKLSLRTKIIHKELCNMFSIAPELFCCCLLSATKSALESTFSYTHTFVRYRNKQFTTVPMHISNLGESTNSYKPKIHASKSFQKLCQPLLKDSKNQTNDWQSIDVIQNKLHSEIIKTMRLLSHSEHAKAELEREVEQLRQQVEFQKSIIEEKAEAAAAAALAKEAHEQNKINDQSLAAVAAENNFNLMDLDINKLNELTTITTTTADADTTTNSEELNLKSDLCTTTPTKNSPQVNNKEENSTTPISSTVNEKNSTKKKVISDVNKIQKTDDELVDTVDSPSTSSDMNSSNSDKNLIDLTLPEEEEEQGQEIMNSQNGSADETTAINAINKYS